MDFNPLSVVRPTLAVLVVDLRNSSEFFRDCDLSAVQIFIREFSKLTYNVLRDTGDISSREIRVVKFTGDGFLILFAEPESHLAVASADDSDDDVGPEVVVTVAPARALAVARRLRERTPPMFQGWQKHALGRSAPADVGIVSGIVYGQIAYGPVARPLSHHHDIAGERVITAFRFSQHRATRKRPADRNQILVCEGTRSSVEAFVASDLRTAEPQVRSEVEHARYAPLNLKSLKGVSDPTCYAVTWRERRT